MESTKVIQHIHTDRIPTEELKKRQDKGEEEKEELEKLTTQALPGGSHTI